MHITATRAYQIDLPLHEGSYKWSVGNEVAVFDSTAVAVETDSGLTGWERSARSAPPTCLPTQPAPGLEWPSSLHSSSAPILWR